jgi:nucleoside-diphosphate-sugar epimerase
MRVLVTGASGFLGGAVCTALADAGHEVAAVVRSPGSEPAGTRALQADLTDEGALADAVTQAEPDTVVHLAAEIATQRDPDRIDLVNITGTERLLAACTAAATLPRFVFASTVVTGEASGAVLDEETPLPVETAYGRSKQEGERLVRESGLEHAILRPSHVYGPGGWFAVEIVARLRGPGRAAVVGKGDNWWDVVHVDDVAAGFVAAAEKAPSGAVYHLVDDEPITQYDFVALVARALGTGKPRRVPPWIARLAAGADPVRAVIRSARSSNAKAKSQLGWMPRFPTAEEGVPDAVRRIDRG